MHKKIKTSKSDVILKIVAYIVIALFAIFCFYPLLMTLSVSFSSNSAINRNGYSIIPQDFSLDTYIYIFGHSGKAILKSYGVTISDGAGHPVRHADYQHDVLRPVHQQSEVPERDCIPLRLYDYLLRRSDSLVRCLHQILWPGQQFLVFDDSFHFQRLEYVPAENLLQVCSRFPV